MIRDIGGYEGLYAITEDGKVWSFRSKMWLKTPDRGNGYPVVCLCAGQSRKNLSVHRLVAEAFLPNPEKKPQVNHIDGDKTNNHMINLEWVTVSENILHAHATGLATAPSYWTGIRGSNHPTYGIRGEHHPSAISGRIKMPCGDRLVFKAISDLCREFNLNAGHISEVLSGKRKSHKGWTAVCT